MIKTVWVVWDDGQLTPTQRREALVDRAAPALLRAGAVRLSVLVTDEAAAVVKSPTPFTVDAHRAVGLVNVWTDAVETIDVASVLQAEGFRVAGYTVEESVYKDYGDNAHAAPRSWPDGVRSPGVTAITMMERPARLSHAEWLRRWHGNMSPVSEAIQPRTRYVRNVVTGTLTPGAPPFAGIVEEAWPSPEHVTNPYKFYGASGTLALVRNQLAILRAVTAFLTLWRVRTWMGSEWFVRS